MYTFFFLDTVNLWLMLGTFHKAGLVLFMHTQSSNYTMCSKGLFFLFKLPWVTWDNQMVFRNRILIKRRMEWHKQYGEYPY